MALRPCSQVCYLFWHGWNYTTCPIPVGIYDTIRGMGFFKAYDMRGTFGVDFDLETVEKVGRALPQVVGGRRWLVGRDCRTTSKAVRDALVKGLTAAGAEVTDLGLATTPMVYFFTVKEDFDGSVMITASHNPPSDNGLKVSRKGGLPVGYESGLKEVEAIVHGAA